MRKVTIALRFYGEDEEPKRCEGIEHEGQIWLVTRWLENQELGIAMPARIVSTANLECAPPPPPMAKDYELVVLTPIPESLFDLDIPASNHGPFVVRDHPAIQIELPREGRTLQ